MSCGDDDKMTDIVKVQKEKPFTGVESYSKSKVANSSLNVSPLVWSIDKKNQKGSAIKYVRDQMRKFNLGFSPDSK